MVLNKAGKTYLPAFSISRRMLKCKRGMFFTLLAIVIISIFVLSFIFIPGREERKTVERRIETMNNFVFAVEEDLPRHLYTAGFRSIFIFEREILDGSYINSLDEKFNELFFNGTLEGQTESLMRGANFSEIERKLREKAWKINANLSLFNASVEISQVDPWNVRVRLNATLVVEDFSGLVGWNKNSFFDAYIPIENFDDPVYVMGTGGKVLHKMVRANNTNFADRNVLLAHVENSYYIASPNKGSSFLKRLQGDFSPDANGVESLVNLPELSQKGIYAIYGKSIVDYIYFSNSDPTSCVVDSGLPEWFNLDNDHFSTYSITSCA